MDDPINDERISPFRNTIIVSRGGVPDI